MKDLTGLTFGYLTPVSRIAGDIKHKAKWVCNCKCGNTTIVPIDSLTSGKTQSCGCKKLESHNKRHGMTKEPIHKIWCSMRQRCNDKNHTAFKNYGAKGITICVEWNSFENFYKWAMQNGYKDGLSIDRIDNLKGYSPDNCRWVSWRKQCNNRRSNIMVTYNGVTLTLKEMCDSLNANYKLIYQRMYKYGYDFETALTSKPYENRFKPKTTI